MRPGPIIASVLYGVTLGFDAVVLILAVRTANIPMAAGQPPLLEQLPFYVPILLAYSTVGAVVAARRPRNPIGWLFSAVAFLFAGALLIGGYSAEVHATGSPAARAFVDAFGDKDPLSVVVVIFSFVLLLYPTGRLPSPRWIPVAALVALSAFLGPLYTGPGHELFGLTLPLTVATPFIRLRRASPVERRQIEWFVYFLALTVISFIASLVVGAFSDNLGGYLWAFAAFCAGMTGVAAGVAILRYRLYDIDLLIRRTLVYAAISAVLLAAYLGGLALFESILAPFTAGNGIAVASSTLAVVALFQPLRRRIGSTVDRRFYRSRYDAERTLDAFAVRLRDQIDLASLERELIGVVNDTMQPTHASVWLRQATR